MSRAVARLNSDAGVSALRASIEAKLYGIPPMALQIVEAITPVVVSPSDALAAQRARWSAAAHKAAATRAARRGLAPAPEAPPPAPAPAPKGRHKAARKPSTGRSTRRASIPSPAAADAPPAALAPSLAPPASEAEAVADALLASRVTWPGGWAKVGDQFDLSDDMKKRAAKIRAQLPKVNGKRGSALLLRPPTPATRYDDPATSTRTVEKALADLTAKVGPTADRHRGLLMMKGWTVQHTDGRVAIVRPGAGTAKAKPMFDRPATVATLTPDFWASYRPVRQLRGETGGVTWTIGRDQIAVHAQHHEYGEARGWAPMPTAEEGDPISFMADDAYLWLLRDLPWQVAVLDQGTKAPAAVFTLGEVRVVVQGMIVK